MNSQDLKKQIAKAAFEKAKQLLKAKKAAQKTKMCKDIKLSHYGIQNSSTG